MQQNLQSGIMAHSSRPSFIGEEHSSRAARDTWKQANAEVEV